jgi:hypothetical protein
MRQAKFQIRRTISLLPNRSDGRIQAIFGSRTKVASWPFIRGYLSMSDAGAPRAVRQTNDSVRVAITYDGP